jgi:hypothetical protein
MKSKLVLWAGAGVSIWSPTSLPLGFDLKLQLLRQVLDAADRQTARFHSDLSRADSSLSRVVNDITPEAFFEIAVRTLGSDFISDLSPVFMSAEPNCLHFKIAQILAETAKRRYVYLITTNYDLCFETSFRRMGVEFETVLPSSSRPRSNRCNVISIIKPHGSSDRPSTIVLALSREVQGLSPEFRSYLLECLSNADVFLMGYSSCEPDLVPVLLDSKVHSLGIVTKDMRTLYANYVHRMLIVQHHGWARVGFVNGLISLSSIAGVPSGDVPGLRFSLSHAKSLPKIKMTASERRVIASKILNEVNLCKDAIKLGEKCLAMRPLGLRLKSDLLDVLASAYRGTYDFERSMQYARKYAVLVKGSRLAKAERELDNSILRLDLDRAESLCLRTLRMLPKDAGQAAKASELRFHLGRIHLYRGILGGRLTSLERRRIGHWFRRYGIIGKRQGRLDCLLLSQQHLARLDMLAGKYSRALNAFEANRFWWRLLGRRQGMINNLRDEAKTLYLMSRLPKAYRVYRQVLLEIDLTRSDAYGKFKALWWLRRLSIEMRKAAAARLWDRQLQQHLHANRRITPQWGALLAFYESTSGLIS